MGVAGDQKGRHCGDDAVSKLVAIGGRGLRVPGTTCALGMALKGQVTPTLTVFVPPAVVLKKPFEPCANDTAPVMVTPPWRRKEEFCAITIDPPLPVFQVRLGDPLTSP